MVWIFAQVASIRVAGETRKSQQIARDGSECDARQEMLAAEARASWQRMETILAKWGLAGQKNDALELNALLTEQKSNHLRIKLRSFMKVNPIFFYKNI